jgi:hypothetical protein
MSDPNTEESKQGVVIAWWLLAGFAFLLAAAHKWMVGWVELYQPNPLRLGESVRLAFVSRDYLMVFPFSFACAASLCPRINSLRSGVALAIGGILLCLQNVIICYAILMPAVVKSAYSLPHRLPQSMRDVVRNADHMEILSLDPSHEIDRTAKDRFHGYRILGRTVLSASGQRTQLAESFLKSMEDYDWDVAMCFSPRHGLIVRQGWKKVEVVICFECAQLYASNQMETFRAAIGPIGSSDFNAVLKAAGVPLAKQPPK